MINGYFKEKSPFCYNYFSTLIEQIKENKSKFPQAIIFEGANTILQYYFSLELAIELNKLNNNNPTDEKWIKSYTHPAINLISQIHGKPDDDTTKTVISVKQAKAIESALKLSSDYYRFYIFFSSREYEYSESEISDFKKLGYNTDIDFSIEPIEYNTFNIAALNGLLKSVEEPPNNTVFIFLTNSKENILPTITSRCQVFKLSSNNSKYTYDDISEITTLYEKICIQNCYEISDKIIVFSTDNHLEVSEILNKFIVYLKDLIITNDSNYNKLINDINYINLAIKMIKSNVSEKMALETMVFRIARGY